MGVLRFVSAGGLAALLAASAAQAHVSASPKEAQAGAYQVVRFGVGHACAGADATTAVRLEMPDGLPSARPQPKPGWTLSIERGTGGPESVKAIVWRGRLPADQFEEFVVMMRLPDRPGPLFIPAIQTCGDIETRWTEIPPMDAAPRPERPAPAIRLLPRESAAPGPAAPAGHQHP
jgi:uncharacterized protein YcnI